MSRHAALRARYRVALSILFLFTLPWLAIAAHAAEDCAGNAQQLIQYLNKAETQTTPYKIKVVAGTYALHCEMTQWYLHDITDDRRRIRWIATREARSAADRDGHRFAVRYFLDFRC